MYKSFSSGVGVKFVNAPANGKRELILEETSKTLLINKKQGNQDLVHASYIIKPTQTSINHEKCNFCVIKSLKHLKNFKTWRVTYFGLELTCDHACRQKPNPSRETFPFKYKFKKKTLPSTKICAVSLFEIRKKTYVLIVQTRHICTWKYILYCTYDKRLFLSHLVYLYDCVNYLHVLITYYPS